MKSKLKILFFGAQTRLEAGARPHINAMLNKDLSRPHGHIKWQRKNGKQLWAACHIIECNYVTRNIEFLNRFITLPTMKLENIRIWNALEGLVDQHPVFQFFSRPIASWLPPGRSPRCSMRHIVHELMHKIHNIQYSSDDATDGLTPREYWEVDKTQKSKKFVGVCQKSKRIFSTVLAGSHPGEKPTHLKPLWQPAWLQSAWLEAGPSQLPEAPGSGAKSARKQISVKFPANVADRHHLCLRFMSACWYLFIV